MFAPDAHDLLEQLLTQRAVHPSAELEREIEEALESYVGQAVTEIASLRAVRQGPLRG